MLTRLATPTSGDRLKRRALPTTTRRRHTRRDGDAGEHQAVAEELGVAGHHRGATRAALLVDRPRHQPCRRRQEGRRDDATGNERRRPRRPAAQLHRLDAGALTARLAEAGTAAQHPLQTGCHHGEQEHDGGDLTGSVTIVGAAPDAEHADGHRLDVEVLHRGEIGQRLHGDDGRPGGDGRPEHRHDDATRRRRPGGAERPGDEVGGRRLVAQGGTGEQVHIRVQRQGQGENGARHRAHLGEPRITAQLVPPPHLDRAGHPEHRRGDEAENVTRHGEWQHQRPAQHAASGEVVGADQPGQSHPQPDRDHEHPDRQHERGDHLVRQPGLPLLAPHLRVRPQHAGRQHGDRHDGEGGDDDGGDDPAGPIDTPPTSGGVDRTVDCRWWCGAVDHSTGCVSRSRRCPWPARRRR